MPLIAWLPIAAGIGSLLGKIFGGGSKPATTTQTTTSQPQKPQWLSPSQLGVPESSQLYDYLMSGLIPGSDQPTITETSGGGSSWQDVLSNTSSWSKVTPTYSYGSQSVVDMLPKIFETQLAQGGKITPAEKAGVMNQIARLSNTAQKSVAANLQERGLLSSPNIQASTEAVIKGKQVQSLADFLTQLPFMERQNFQSQLTTIGQLLQSLFQGQSMKGGSTTRTTTRGGSSQSSKTVTQTPGGKYDPVSALNLGLWNPGGSQTTTGTTSSAPNFADYWGAVGNLIAQLWGMGVFNKPENQEG